MRIVLDTNVLVSALLNPQGPPARILDLIVGGPLKLLADNRILYEYREVLLRPKFGFDPDLVDELIALLDKAAEFIAADFLSDPIPDPDDRPFLEIALAGKAEVLITGNKKDFGKPPQGLKILLPSEFLKFSGM